VKIARLAGEPQDGVANPAMANRWLKHLDSLCTDAIALCPESDLDKMIGGLAHEAVECFGTKEHQGPLSVALAIPDQLDREVSDAFGAEIELYCFARKAIVASLERAAP
jgi:hypothetical protein